MLTEHRPFNGANFMRLDLATVKQGLDTLLEAGDAAGGWLTPEQCLWFNRYCTAWAFYKPSQPEQYQAEFESAIGAIFGYEVDHRSMRPPND